MTMIDDVSENASKKMQTTLTVVKHELASIRTGRASSGLVEHIKVEYAGVPTPLNQIASVTAREANLLVIQPWDPTAIRNIEQAILKSDLGLNPNNDGRVVRLPIPPLSEERRQELIKVVHKRVEDGKIALRNIRREAIDELRKMEKDKEISQDEQKRAGEQIQKLTDGFTAELEQSGKEKEAELMEV
jgi:ribosome recycling factor